MASAFVTVASFRYAPHAAAAKAVLEVNGIDAALQDRESSTVWGGSVGGVDVQVRHGHVDAARAVLSKWSFAESAAEPAKESSEKDACLVCGHELDVAQGRCAVCGWTVGAEAPTDYENGPVPDELLPFARSPLGSRRFALPIDVVDRYLRWSESEGLEIRGWQLWLPGLMGHMVLETVENGDAAKLRGATSAARARWGEHVLVSVNVAKSAGEESDAAS